MMKNLLTKLRVLPVLFFITQTLSVHAQYTYDWAHNYEIRNDGYNWVGCVGTDDLGNYYVAGEFDDTLDLDLGAGVFEVYPCTNAVFIAKYTSSGDLVWGKSIGQYDNLVRIADMKVDGAGNIYAVGYFTTGPVNNVDFDPGPAVYGLSNGSSVLWVSYVLKWDNNGNFLWVKDIVSNTSPIGVQANSVDIDQNGNVFVAGTWGNGMVGFGLPDNFSISSVGTSTFIAKYSSAGSFQWAKHFDADVYTIMPLRPNLKFHSSGLYLAGYFMGNTDFNTSVGVDTLNAITGQDVYIAKLDSAGNYLWAKQIPIGIADFSKTIDLALDNTGNVYTVGKFGGTVDFDPGVGTANIISAGGNDAFMVKLDESGNYIWAKSIGSSAINDMANNVEIDQANNLIVGGLFEATIDFDPGAGTQNVTSSGATDPYILEMDLNGNFGSVYTYGGSADDNINNLAIDYNGDVLIGGIHYSPDMDFDRGSGIMNGYVLKLTSPTSSVEDELLTNNIQVYPNPTANEITISNVEEGSTIKIINVHGQVIVNQKAMNQMVNISVMDLANGMYIVQLENNKETIQKKLIVKK